MRFSSGLNGLEGDTQTDKRTAPYMIYNNQAAALTSYRLSDVQYYSDNSNVMTLLLRLLSVSWYIETP